MSILASRSVKFLRDENVKRRLERFLKQQGVDIISKPKGLSNGKLAEFSLSEQRILVTNDKHFTNSSVFPKEKIFSIVLLRIPQDKSELLIEEFSKLLEKKSSLKDFEGYLITLYEDRFELDPIPSREV